MELKIVLKDADQFKMEVLKAGFSLRKLAKKINISSGYVTQIANGVRNPGPKVAKDITDAIGVHFDDVFCIQNACKSGQITEKKNTA